MITAQVVLINEEGYVLGVSRKDDHTNFGLPGGKMEEIDDNNPTNTAIRETKEETGLDVSNLRLIFAMHKDGNMGYTYLASYRGEINHNEPHVVKWVTFTDLINGRFGKYNKMVSESLDDIGIKYLKRPLPSREYLFGVIENKYVGYSLVCVTSREYFDENNCVPYPWSEKDSEDIFNLCENSNISLGESDETSFEVSKNNKILNNKEEIIQAMTIAGFIYDEKLNDEI